ncbi:TPR repeat-containing protein [Nitrosospira multiformis ATCC 25196]|uniref:TPR repeat-containing protein n=1 Tax=Nitrosospira multiformis (strain ATCC 25196 / NCIMB 11849 / C 71) TaxID=323848 RepID=Q2YD45_NITMU|nr:tetratricopeptide repeat-containing serine protease family protein [Nitrosospira multiformis]ABB73326.1 tetratricopeptide TPR_3 [Nitrosospira multiformis ATCC 25196]SEG01543.1 TPR repeat-containing protein [Nitrosospira multiformis ATCC 25196]
MTAISSLALLVFASALFLPLLPGASAKTPEQVFTEERGSIVSIDMLNARGELAVQGSGVALGADQVITTCDVARQAESARVGWAGRIFKAKPAPSQTHLNLCRLRVAGMHAPSLALGGAEKLRVGQPVNAIGLPHARLGGRLKGNRNEERRNGRDRICPMCDGSKVTGLQEEHRRDPILAEGVVAVMRPYAGSRYMRISAPLLPGFSGGGLFDEQGQLVGILSPQRVEGESLAFVLPSDWLDSLPKMTQAPRPMDPKSADPGHGLVWLNQTLALEKKADWRRLLKLSQQETGRDPSNAAAWFNVGIASCNLKQYSQAVNAYREAIRHHAGYADAWHKLGMAYAHLKDYENASQAYEDAVRLDPDNGEAWYDLGNTYHHLKKYAHTIHAYRHALRIDPKNFRAWYNWE